MLSQTKCDPGPNLKKAVPVSVRRANLELSESERGLLSDPLLARSMTVIYAAVGTLIIAAGTYFLIWENTWELRSALGTMQVGLAAYVAVVSALFLSGVTKLVAHRSIQAGYRKFVFDHAQRSMALELESVAVGDTDLNDS